MVESDIFYMAIDTQILITIFDSCLILHLPFELCFISFFIKVTILGSTALADGHTVSNAPDLF